MKTKNRMTIDEAIAFLADCDRYETLGQDDKEVYWLKDGKGVATGYFGGLENVALVSILAGDGSIFREAYAKKLESLGTLKTLTS